MKCITCNEDTDVKDTRVLTTEDGVCFVRRIRYCPNKHQSITHEIIIDQSPIPDIYRLKRIRKIVKPKKQKKQKKDAWLKRIMSKLD